MKTKDKRYGIETAIAEHKKVMRLSDICKSGRCGDNHKEAIRFYLSMLRKNKVVRP